MTKTLLVTAAALLAAAFVTIAADRTPPRAEDPVAHGRYLVSVLACDDCHTPWHMTDSGPAPDPSRRLSGHPAALAIAAAPDAPPAPWNAMAAATNTAWAGPWGVSFTANLTPDPDTGLGKWTAADFIATIRNARHMGRGRALLPPMPAPAYANLTDDDLTAVFAYLQSLQPNRNRVPDPLPPASAR